MHLTHQFDSKSIATKDRRNKATNEGVSLPSRTIVHAKLEMTSPQDAEELEADAVANEIVSGGKIRRKISQGSTGSSGIAVSSQMESMLSRLQGGGQQMPSGLRHMMENGFGRDFSQVRLHTDGDAAAMSSSIHAKAFTLGNDIYFNRGEYSPDSSEGQKLVAHELTHVMQGDRKLARETTLCEDNAWTVSRYYNRVVDDGRKIAKLMLNNAIDKLKVANTIIDPLAKDNSLNVNKEFEDFIKEMRGNIKSDREFLRKNINKNMNDDEKNEILMQTKIYEILSTKAAGKRINQLFFGSAKDQSGAIDISGILFLLEYCFGLGQSDIYSIIDSLQDVYILLDQDKAFEKLDKLMEILNNRIKEIKNHYKNHYMFYKDIIDKILKGYDSLNTVIDSVVIVVANIRNGIVNNDGPAGWACNSSESNQKTTVNNYDIKNTIFLNEKHVAKKDIGEIASTIIHELSHVFLKTLDVRYFGSKKNGEDNDMSKDLTNNADSYSVFAKYLYSSEYKLSTHNNGQSVSVSNAKPLPKFDTFSDSIYEATSIKTD